jgi:hypothetical protein
MSSAPSCRIAVTLTGFAHLRDADPRAHAELARRERHGLTVVSGRGRDQPAGALVVRQLRDEVEAAAHLERARRLVVLVLDPHARAHQRVEPGIAAQRRRAQEARDPPPRGEDIGEGRDRVHCGCIPQRRGAGAASAPEGALQSRTCMSVP